MGRRHLILHLFIPVVIGQKFPAFSKVETKQDRDFGFSFLTLELHFLNFTLLFFKSCYFPSPVGGETTL